MVRSAEEMVVRSSVRVPLGVDEAFRLFTERMHEWWPLPSHSVYGEDAVDVRVDPRVDGAIIERTKDGRTAEWGTMTVWDAPRRLAFTWYPGQDARFATNVEVTFVASEAGGTQVELVHTGWEARGERAAELVQSYGPGGELVLGRFEERARNAG